MSSSITGLRRMSLTNPLHNNLLGNKLSGVSPCQSVLVGNGTASEARLPKLERPGGNNRQGRYNPSRSFAGSVNGKSSARPRRLSIINRSNSQNSDITYASTFIIRFKSNWGNENLISCSEIDFLNEQTKSIQIDMTTIKPTNLASDKLQNLVDASIHKSGMETCWSAPWPQIGPIEICCSILEPANVSMVRFVNGNFQGNSAVKEVEIWEKDHIIWKGEVDRVVGAIAHLDQFAPQASILVDVYAKPRNPLIFLDNHGLLPQLEYNKITFKIIETYQNQELFGLSGLEMFRADNSQISKDEIAKITYANCRLSSSTDELFRTDYRHPTKEQMLIGTSVNNKKPLLTVIFKNPTIVGMIRFWNYYADDYPVSIGIKKIKIMCENISLYSGCLHQGDGTAIRFHRSVTQVYLTDQNCYLKCPFDEGPI